MNDIHSFSRPDEAVVRHLALDLDVDFENQRLSGSATLQIDTTGDARELVLDTNGLTINRVTLNDGNETTFALGDPRTYLGRPLTIALRPGTK
jgi:leukotriene-A4 hydrolase